MRKAIIRKRKRLFTLILLTIGMITVRMNISQLSFTANNFITDNLIDKDVDWIDETPMKAYSNLYNDSGANLEVLFHQSYLNTNTIQFTNLSDSSNNTFTVPCPKESTFNSSLTNFTIENINAPNKTLNIELGTTDTQLIVGGRYYGFSFEILSSCFLHNFSMCFSEDNIDDTEVRLQLYDAVYDHGENRMKPQSNLNLFSIFQSIPQNTQNQWYNFTPDVFLNISDTNNKTFFIVVNKPGLEGDPMYNYEDDGIDNSAVWRNAGSGWNDYYDRDGSLKIHVGLDDNTPKPSTINITLNNVSVLDIGSSNEGYCLTQNQQYTDSDGNLDYEMTADWWDVSCDITSTQNNYTKTDISANTQFFMNTNSQYVWWNVTIDENVDWFDHRLDVREINFTLPLHWENIWVRNGLVNQTKTITPSSSQIVTVHDAGNGTHWNINASSTNLLDNVYYIVDDILIPDKIVNFTNIVHFNASFKKFINTNDGLINLSVYSPSSQTLNFTMQNTTFSSGFNISLGNWNIPQSIPYGVHTVQLYWSNDTDAGFIEDELTIIADTNLSLSIPEAVYNITESFILTVNYTDIGKGEGIEDAMINYSLDGGNTYRFDNVVFWQDGLYNITINCYDGDFGVPHGVMNIIVNASKQFHNNHSETISFTRLGETDIEVNNVINANYDSGDVFNITIRLHDIWWTSGVANPIINYTLNGGDRWRTDNITYLGTDEWYNITVYCNDTDFEDYGEKTIIVNFSKQYYNNQSQSFTINITGETCVNYFYDAKPFYYSNESFYIVVTYNDTSRNTNLDPSTAILLINGTESLQGLGFNPPFIPGVWNLTVNCSLHQEFQDGNWGHYNLTFIASRDFYYTSYNFTTIWIKGSTSLDLVSPAENYNYIDGEIYNITVQYNDTIKREGVADADIGFSFDGSNWYENENVTDLGNGRYTIEIHVNDLRMNYGWETILINASKLNYSMSQTSFRFEKQIRTNVTTNTASLGPIERGQLVSFLFNYTDITNKPITDYNWSRISSYQGFGETLDYINGQYNLTLDSSNVDVTNSPFTYIFNISAFGNQTQIITLTITVTISYTNIENVSYQSLIARNSGLNQTVVFYFNDTTKAQPVLDLITDNIVVYNNNTGAIWNTGDFNWMLHDKWGNGTYILNVSLNGLDYGWYTLKINASKFPNYDISITYITFYLRGNYSQINMISVSDPGGIISPVGIGNNYSSFLGSDIIVEFNMTDLEYANKVILGEANLYVVSYLRMGDWASGVLVNDIQFAYDPDTPTYGTFSGTIDTSTLTEPGYYMITITVIRLNYETVSYIINLTIGNKYDVNVQVEYHPSRVTAGGQFLIRFNATYFDGVSWNALSGATLRVTPLFNGGETTEQYINSTDSNGRVEFTIIVLGSAITMNLTVEILSAYYHGNISITVADFTVVQPPGGGIDPGDLLFYLIIIGIAIGAVVGVVGVYRGVIVPKKREKARVLNEVKTIFDDAVSLEHILVLYKSSGMCIFFKSFGLEEIDPELISGFLSAVSTFGKEMESQEMLNEIAYGDKVILLSDGEYVRVALVLGKKPSIPIRGNLKEFITAFENNYAKILPSWKGNLKAYQDTGIIVDEILNTSIILPHEIKYSSSGVKSLKKANSKDILKIAQRLVADSERPYFFIGQLLTLATEKLEKEIEEIFMGIKELRDKKMLVPIEISAIEEQPITEQELNLIRQKVSQLTHLAPEVTEKLVTDIASIKSPAEREAFLVSLGEHQTIVSAPVKGGAAIIDDEKSAKKEIKSLLNKALKAEKKDDFKTALEIYHNAGVIASNYELSKQTDEINDFVRKATIHESEHKKHDFEEKAKKAVKTAKYKEAAQLYQLASDMASQIFKLGRTDMTKEVKRLTNKSKECEKLGE